MRNLSPKWRSFLSHLGSYFIIIGMLAIINLITTDYPWVIWPALGWGVGIAFHILAMLLGEDQAEAEESQQQPVAVERSRPDLADRTIQTHLNKALAYQEQIHRLVALTEDERSKARLQELADQVDGWVQAIEALARRVDGFHRNRLIREDLESVPQAIDRLESRLAEETDPTIQADLEHTLATHKNQLASLERLQTIIKRAEMRIESTLSALGTIYSQVLTTQSTDHVADYSHLSEEVDEEMHLLRDHLDALEEVKLNRTGV